MKTAIVTDDQKTISQHFGHTEKYLVVEIEGGQIINRQVREKPGHKDHDHASGHEHEHSEGHSVDKHKRMADAIADCDFLLARGMGQNAQNHIKKAGVEIYQVDFVEIEEALKALIAGEIEAHIHEQSCGHH